MSRPSVSIIVPVYNVEPYVEDCVRSVMRQTYAGPMECIVVNDCGTDNSMAVVDRLISEYNGPILFKVLHHEHNRGLSAARNTGINAATGDYLFFLDSDDEIKTECIEILISEILKDDHIEIVQGNTKRIPERIPDSFFKEITDSHILTNEKVRLCYFKNQQLIHNAWNKLINRSFVIKNNLYFKEGILYEDLLWTFKLLKHCTNVFFVTYITYFYRIRPNSIITLNDEREIATYDKVVYSEILADLTPGHEKEELFYFAKRCTNRYVNDNTSEYDDIFNLFWDKTKRYGYFSCYLVLAFAYLRKRSKLFRVLYVILRRMRLIDEI